MVQKKEQIKNFILSYWDKVKGSIKCETYTMDLALEPNLEHAYIIELNGPVFSFFSLSPSLHSSFFSLLSK
jgi:hypothetical protein